MERVGGNGAILFVIPSAPTLLTLPPPNPSKSKCDLVTTLCKAWLKICLPGQLLGLQWVPISGNQPDPANPSPFIPWIHTSSGLHPWTSAERPTNHTDRSGCSTMSYPGETHTSMAVGITHSWSGSTGPASCPVPLGFVGERIKMSEGHHRPSSPGTRCGWN